MILHEYMCDEHTHTHEGSKQHIASIYPWVLHHYRLGTYIHLVPPNYLKPHFLVLKCNAITSLCKNIHVLANLLTQRHISTFMIPNVST